MSNDTQVPRDDAPDWLSQNEIRRPRSTVRTLVEALRELEFALAPPRSAAPMPRVTVDITGGKPAGLSAELLALRPELESLAGDFGTRPAPVSRRRLFVAQASYAWTVAEEMNSRRLERGHEINHELVAKSGPRVDRLATEFRTLAGMATNTALSDTRTPGTAL